MRKNEETEQYQYKAGQGSGVEEVRKIVAVLVIIILFLVAILISTKLGLTAYVAWMEENHFRQPSDKDMQRLIGWCVKKYIQELFRKS